MNNQFEEPDQPVVVEAEELVPAAKITSGTGSGFEILCQGFNWESHKSGRWYMELREKVAELSSLGFTVVWLPPPTDSVSPEGYMPKDLYNLNSREEIGYDGWRLDFVRGFWGGYVKDYIEASEPYFAVGEYWDSLNYTHGDMDHNQDAHRQRIVDWINDTNGTAIAFDVTTKGILHLCKHSFTRCYSWLLEEITSICCFYMTLEMDQVNGLFKRM
ncbi:hypothetical protein LOK49_LG01G04156 [Camellia lanceoleosa]|uniref:Uncharacterized protein n=1 Tax=Camellia lanceoleosa TaxID=1840588 RepID=A0ACC0ITH1_9ERIC|nr:hypothetical protein LOK49_LG01G04156 [Camellia lanceoleosa]